jgi:prepilin-type N-terminal cleavage/methylation domain-containing protein
MKQKTPLASAHGAFTLIELMVAVAIFGMLSVLLGQFFVNFTKLKFNAETVQRIRQEGNYVLDRIDYLLRNSLTLPDVCVGSNRDVAGTTRGESGFDPADGGGGNPFLAQTDRHELRANISGMSTGQFQRALVKIENADDDLAVAAGGPLVIYLPPPTTSTATLVRHGASGFIDDDYKIYLTSEVGAVGTATKFLVRDLIFDCQHNHFTGGYVVTTSFNITYNRSTLSQYLAEDWLREDFERKTAIRVTAPFEY